ncbi:MAG: hypothetical protein C4586_08680 [Anaerolineaceae bacterium]|nr:MAG: hypothetical protein C4586_08680 [Anaerolineaceae bacterium]
MSEELNPIPCPSCGEDLVKKDDHHGDWWAHKNDLSSCIFSFIQLMDQSDVKRWNIRPTIPGL